jgi:hypothetical protein
VTGTTVVFEEDRSSPRYDAGAAALGPAAAGHHPGALASFQIVVQRRPHDEPIPETDQLVRQVPGPRLPGAGKTGITLVLADVRGDSRDVRGDGHFQRGLPRRHLFQWKEQEAAPARRAQRGQLLSHHLLL